MLSSAPFHPSPSFLMKPWLHYTLVYDFWGTMKSEAASSTFFHSIKLLTSHSFPATLSIELMPLVMSIMHPWLFMYGEGHQLLCGIDRVWVLDSSSTKSQCIRQWQASLLSLWLHLSCGKWQKYGLAGCMSNFSIASNCAILMQERGSFILYLANLPLAEENTDLQEVTVSCFKTARPAFVYLWDLLILCWRCMITLFKPVLCLCFNHRDPKRVSRKETE